MPPDGSQGWLMRMGFRLSLALVVAAVLFAVARAVCDQLAGLGVGASSVAAGALAIVAFGLTMRVTRPELPRVRDLRSAHAKPDGLRCGLILNCTTYWLSQVHGPASIGVRCRRSPGRP